MNKGTILEFLSVVYYAIKREQNYLDHDAASKANNTDVDPPADAAGICRLRDHW